MNDDIEKRLSRLTPLGLQPELREQILAAVESELLSTTMGTEESVEKTTPILLNDLPTTSSVPLRSPSAQSDSRWLRRAARVVAASLLLGIVLNIWAAKSSERRLAQLFGPPPISKGAMEIAKAIEEITDAKTGQWVYRQFTQPRRPGDMAAAQKKYRTTLKQLIDELQTVSKDTYHETPQKDSEVDRDRTGRIDRDTSDCQRLVRLDHRHTA